MYSFFLFSFIFHYFEFFATTCGIRQGGVLSPYLLRCLLTVLYNVYRPLELAVTLNLFVSVAYYSLYADDILLLAPSVTALQQLLRVCETELACLDIYGC